MIFFLVDWFIKCVYGDGIFFCVLLDGVWDGVVVVVIGVR